jgi:hypothetical protein
MNLQPLLLVLQSIIIPTSLLSLFLSFWVCNRLQFCLFTISDTNEADNGLRKPELSRNLRYIDTRMDDVFPVKKSRFRMLSGKENAKVNTFPSIFDLTLVFFFFGANLLNLV